MAIGAIWAKPFVHALIHQISCTRWLPLHGLGTIGLLAFAKLFDLSLGIILNSLSSMILRVLLVATLVLACGPALAAPMTPIAQPAPTARPTPAVRPVPRTPPVPPMTFYVAKGAADSCGRGCDSWIAVEGQVDSGAAPRFRKFFQKVRDRKLPIYFSSPGGNLDQALAMGAMLREKPVTARVARTVVRECGFEAQDSDVCLKLKQSGRELHGELWTRGAMCNSACPYLMLGATTREIAPDAVLAVHSPKVVVHFSGLAPPSREMRAAATERGHERADRMVASYIVKMGVDIGLLDLASTVKFEDIHVLTREEIVRFGIDRREQVETPWIFENIGRSTVRKVATEKNDGDKSYRLSQWRLFCFNTDQFELDFQRPVATSSVFPTVRISNGGSISLYFKSPPVKSQGFEIWGVRMSRAQLQSLADVPQFDFTETSQTPDGHRLAHTATFSSEGLAGALDSLLATCSPARPTAPITAVPFTATPFTAMPVTAPAQTIGARDSVAK
jgi:hypothetical protein